MNLTALLFAIVIVLPAGALVAWALFAMARVDEELQSFTVLEGLHFEIGPQAATGARDAR